MPVEPLDADRLSLFLKENLPGFEKITATARFSGGFSNLTFQVDTNLGPFVLRRPPVGANVKGGHDMGREFRLLSAVRPFFEKIPAPVLFCENSEILGAPFFLMEKIEGYIFRKPSELASFSPGSLEKLSVQFAEIFAEIHQIPIENNALSALGKPVGFVERQVAGWIERYEKCKTEDLPAMRKTMDFLQNTVNSASFGQRPGAKEATLLHNDFKHDNLIFQKIGDENLDLRAVLDWEMAALGDPLMDLGTSLGYWFEAGEEMPGFSGPTTAKGHFSRRELAGFYAEKTGRSPDWLVFYYAFGLFKICVIAQQIFARWKMGVATNPRFGMLGQVVDLLSQKAWIAIQKERI